MADLTSEEIQDRVRYHPPSPEGVTRHQTLAAEFSWLMSFVQQVCPDGRERALVFTKLEEAKMWASAAVARNPETR